MGELVPFLMEVLDRALPGGAPDLKEGIVTWPDGRQERFAFSRVAGGHGGGRWTWITALRFPDRDGAGAAGRASPTSTAAPSCRVIVIEFVAPEANSIPSVVSVADYREAAPELASHRADECNAYVRSEPDGSLDPSTPVAVSFISAHDEPTGRAFILWRATLDSRTMTWLSRVPAMVSRQRGEQSTSDDIDAVESPRDVRFTGRPSGRVLSVPCALSTCKVPPDVVLRVFREGGESR
jgi:hypothetical protein